MHLLKLAAVASRLILHTGGFMYTMPFDTFGARAAPLWFGAVFIYFCIKITEEVFTQNVPVQTVDSFKCIIDGRQGPKPYFQLRNQSCISMFQLSVTKSDSKLFSNIN